MALYVHFFIFSHLILHEKRKYSEEKAIGQRLLTYIQLFRFNLKKAEAKDPWLNNFGIKFNEL